MTDTERALIQLSIAWWQVGWQLILERSQAMTQITAAVAATPRFYVAPADEPEERVYH